jgi:flagellar assembly factor FliW
MVTIPSTRFGQVQVADEAVIDFPCGLVGLPGNRYARLARTADSHFWWLHSLEHADVAVPVTSALRWFDDFKVVLSEEDASRLGTSTIPGSSIHVVVRVDPRTGGLAANLRAPIVVLGSVGHQVLNHARGASLQAPLSSELRVAA